MKDHVRDELKDRMYKFNNLMSSLDMEIKDITGMINQTQRIIDSTV